MFKEAKEQMIDAQLRDMIAGAPDGPITKVAQAASDVTRTQIREGSFANLILPPEHIGNERLAKTLTEDLFVIDRLEPDSPGAKYVPFETVPEGEIITGGGYITPICRVTTPMFTKDLDQLRTYDYPIRKILTDNSIKDGMAAHDRKFIETVNSVVFNTRRGPGTPHPVTGKVQFMDFEEGLNRDTFAEATKMLPRGNAAGKFVARNYIALAHENTLRDILKLDRNAIGGDLAQEHWKNGLSSMTVMGIKCVSTIKNNLVPEGYVYFFAEPSFLGHNYTLTDWTMYVNKEAYFIKWFSYWLGGFSFGNIAGMALARFGQAAETEPFEESSGGSYSGSDTQDDPTWDYPGADANPYKGEPTHPDNKTQSETPTP